MTRGYNYTNNANNIRQPMELRPGEFQSYLTAIYGAAKVQDARKPAQTPERLA